MIPLKPQARECAQGAKEDSTVIQTAGGIFFFASSGPLCGYISVDLMERGVVSAASQRRMHGRSGDRVGRPCARLIAAAEVQRATRPPRRTVAVLSHVADEDVHEYPDEVCGWAAGPSMTRCGAGTKDPGRALTARRLQRGSRADVDERWRTEIRLALCFGGVSLGGLDQERWLSGR